MKPINFQTFYYIVYETRIRSGIKNINPFAKLSNDNIKGDPKKYTPPFHIKKYEIVENRALTKIWFFYYCGSSSLRIRKQKNINRILFLLLFFFLFLFVGSCSHGSNITSTFTQRRTRSVSFSWKIEVNKYLFVNSILLKSFLYFKNLRWHLIFCLNRRANGLNGFNLTNIRIYF